MTNSHKTARKATLMRVRVSAFIPCGVLGSYVACGWAALRGSHSPVFWCGSSYYLARITQYLSSCRKIIVVRPSVTVVPSTSTTRRTGCPLTNVPLVDPRSTSTTWPSSTRSSE